MGKLKYIKPGDIIEYDCSENEKCSEFVRGKWTVIQVYPFGVLTKKMGKTPIKRMFSYGDLVVLGLE